MCYEMANANKKLKGVITININTSDKSIQESCNLINDVLLKIIIFEKNIKKRRIIVIYYTRKNYLIFFLFGNCLTHE